MKAGVDMMLKWMDRVGCRLDTLEKKVGMLEDPPEALTDSTDHTPIEELVVCTGVFGSDHILIREDGEDQTILKLGSGGEVFLSPSEAQAVGQWLIMIAQRQRDR